MKTKLFMIALVSVGLFSSLTSCGKSGQSETVIPEKNAEIAVNVSYPKDGKLTEQFVYSGTISGEEESVVRAKVSENISEVLVSVGQSVKKGTLLVKFDLSSGSTQYEQAKSAYELAQKTHERNIALLKVGGISQMMADQSKTQFDVATANLKAVQNMLWVESPIDGTITNVSVNPGDFISAGTAMMTVSNLSSLKTTVFLSAKDAGKIKVGAPVTLKLVDYPTETAEGRVTEIAKAANPNTRTFETKIRITKSPALYRSGLFVEASIINPTNETALLVPVTALTSKNGRPALFIVQPDSMVKSVIVDLGFRTNEMATILSGITAQDKIVTTGTLLVKDGDKVLPKQAN